MTALWTTAELRAATGGTGAPGDAAGISIDTRTLAPGDLFVALAGQRDGHAHVAEAFARGASGALVQRAVNDPRALRVANTLAGLQALGDAARARFGGRVVAVTGSVGKTTTKEMLRAALSAQTVTHAADASYNNHWGVPLTLARTPRGAGACVVEIGMNHAGEIAPLAALARPHVAIITAVERTHIGHLGSIEAIADEKAAIMSGLVPGGVAILPAESPLLPRLRAHAGAARVITFGAAGDARLLACASDADGSDVRIALHGRTLAFRLGATGRHMAMNALAALAAVDALGFDAERAARTLADFHALAGRGARRRIGVPGGEAWLLDESYNASAASVRAALQVLRLQPARRRIAVLGDMLELGESGPSEHAGLAPDVVRDADVLFACGDLMRHLFDAVPASVRGAHAADADALAPIVAAHVADGDAILVKGSLGSRMRVVVQALDAAPARRSA